MSNTRPFSDYFTDFKDSSQFKSGVRGASAYLNYYDFSSESVTAVASSGTWYKLNTNTVEGFSQNGLSHTNNRATYEGAQSVFDVEGIASISSGNNNEIHIALFKNGVIVPCSEQSVITSAGGRRSAVPFRCLVELSNGDYIEVFVKNESTSTNITIDNINVSLKQL
jgi:hypothetical protein